MEQCNVAKEKTQRCPRKRGGQPGNKNAEGPWRHRTTGNKNAVKTGEFEALFFDSLDPEEKELIQAVQPNKEQLLLQEIQLLTVRKEGCLKE